MSDELLDETDEPMSLRAKILTGVVLTLVLLGAVYLFMRMGSPTIPASRTAPAGHYPLPCPVCHTVTADAAQTGTP